MKTLTLKINDNYYDKILSFLELLPKKAVKIKQIEKEKELKEIEQELLHSINDINTGNTQKVRSIV
jgi:predicted alpha-1,6-mannanase (GH76 family)